MATITPPLQASRIEAPRALHLWHLTSLDAVTVAVTWTLAFAWAVHLRLPWWLPAVVGLSTWAFYIADRLFDARHARTPLRARHHYHWRRRRFFIPFAACCALAALTLVLWKMPLRTEMRDSLVAAAAFTYFAGVHTARKAPASHMRRRRHVQWVRKELLVAIVFTAACALPTLTRSATRLSLLPVLTLYAALAWLNCHAIESWESWNASAARSVRHAAQALAGSALLAACIAIGLHHSRIGLLLLAAASSAAMLGLLNHQRERLTPTTLRALADLVLLTPLALIALS
ncbi:MAG TPA: hypothetical protein VL346_00990 [Acidobacteriaceae bacterium]|nr:hypothetical protein [Acidobacteriaceae bacterium]